MAPSKRGLGWPWDNPKTAFAIFEPSIHNEHITWLFNWELWTPEGLPAGFPHVPQVRLGSQAAQIDKSLAPLGVDKVGHLIGFNEPEMPFESDMSVADGVKLWKEYVLPAKSKYHFRLGSPAMSNSPKGKKWLQDFVHELRGVDGAKLDFIVCHWYGTDIGDFKRFVQDMHDTFKKPIWLTELAYTHLNAAQQPTEQQVLAFEKEALSFLDQQQWVERYAWFGAKMDVGKMVGSANDLSMGGHLTEVGKVYCNA